MKVVRILLTGGGTGGHIYPLIAVSRRIQEVVAPTGADLDLRYFGNPGPFRDELTQNDITVVRIASSKMRRYFDLANILDIFKFWWSILQSLWKVFWFMPDAAFSKGGPGALAIALVLRFYRIPLIVHESDTVPGITNQISVRSAKIVELAFASAQGFLKTKAAVKLVGIPVRRELLTDESAETAKTMLNFDPALPLVLFIGGSQGAEAINNFVLENAASFTEHFQVLHQTGKNNYQSYKNEYAFIAEHYPAETKKRYRFVAYLGDDMRYALRAADLVVSRAGASAIFEIAAAGKPSILIPLPAAAGDHQSRNAYEYGRGGAAVVLSEENLLVSLFANAAEGILGNEEKKRAMAEAARKFYLPGADEKIAADILAIAGVSA